MVVETVRWPGKNGSYTSGFSQLFEELGCILRRCLFKVLSRGPIPSHIAFIMDGNRRFAKKQNRDGGDGHRAGFSALMSMLNYCYELGVKYVTVYAFSIDNFKRGPDEVQLLMDLMLEKIESLLEKQSVVDQYGIRVYFIGNLRLLSEPVRAAAEKVMKATSRNTKTVLLICVAYTSYNEIVHAVQVSCEAKYEEIRTSNLSYGCNHARGSDIHVKINGKVISSSSKVSSDIESDVLCDFDEIQGHGEHQKITVTDIERNMYMAVAPDPDILIRSSGETRLSNFLLWQTSFCPLYSPDALWPEISLRHLVWAVLNFQRCQSYLEKLKKKL